LSAQCATVVAAEHIMLAMAPAKDVGACARLATACRKGVVTDESRLTPVGGGRGGAVDGLLWTCADVGRVLRRRHSVVSAAQPSVQLASWPRGLLLLDADRVGCPVMDFGSFAPVSLPVRMRKPGAWALRLAHGTKPAAMCTCTA